MRRWMKRAVGSVFLLAATAVVKVSAQGTLQKNQRDLMKEMFQINVPQDNGFFSSYRTHPLISTALANLYKPKINQLLKDGYVDLNVKNREGFITRVLTKIHPTEKRPLLVFVAGTGMSVDMETFRYFGIPIANELGWNVALVESTSSGNWIQRNKEKHRLIASGYEAGWDLYLTLETFLQEPFVQEACSEMHLMGLSLGGSDIAFAGYFDSYLKTNYIQSLMAWSSPADRLAGLGHLKKLTGLARSGMQKIFKLTYEVGQEVFLKYSLKDHSYILSPENSVHEVLTEMFYPAAQKYFAEHPHHFKHFNEQPAKLPFARQDSKSAQSLPLSLEQYFSLFSLTSHLEDIDKPLLWVHSINDPIVDIKNPQTFAKMHDLPDHMNLVTFETGGHLGFPVSHGADWVMRVVVNYVLYWGKLPKVEYTQWVKSDNKTKYF